MIEFINVKYRYRHASRERAALAGVDLKIDEGEFVAVVGPNGSGKTTLARLMNGLLVAEEGSVKVDGLDPGDEGQARLVRQLVGMVFQNPDNQIVATVVEEDVAFGPENLGLERGEIRARIDEALAAVDMTDFAGCQPHLLSGGQKQRVAIAGALAMRPKYLVLDEPTSMLDPLGRRRIHDVMRRLNSNGMTIILITHFVEEAALAKRVIAMSDGKVAADGPSAAVLGDSELLESLGFGPPVAGIMAARLAEAGIVDDRPIFTPDELIEAIAGRAVR